MFDATNYPDLESRIEKWYPTCTLCNDTDFWENGWRCICNGEDARKEEEYDTFSWNNIPTNTIWNTFTVTELKGFSLFEFMSFINKLKDISGGDKF